MDVVKKKKTIQKIEKNTNNNSEPESSSNELKLNTKWNIKDKKILLEALQKYGSENIDAISKMLPNISLEDIKSTISKYSEIAKNLYEEELLNKWLKCGLYQPEDSLIPEALLFIQLFENHPSPSELEGYDIRYVYMCVYII